MGFNLSTDEKGCVIYRKDKVSSAGNNYTTYCTKTSSKDANDNWQSAFIEVIFRKGVSVNNKAKINIKKSFPVLNTYNERTTIRWMIMEFDVIENGEEPQTAKTDDGFMNVSDGVEEELPFA